MKNIKVDFLFDYHIFVGKFIPKTRFDVNILCIKYNKRKKFYYETNTTT
jgi:hypothetical protein